MSDDIKIHMDENCNECKNIIDKSNLTIYAISEKSGFLCEKCFLYLKESHFYGEWRRFHEK